MTLRVFSIDFLIALPLIALTALIFATIVGAVRGEGSRIHHRFEAVPLAVAGALLSRTFVSALLALGDDAPGVCLAVAWAFGFWPGLIDTVGRLAGEVWLTEPTTLIWIATATGAFAGMLDGTFHIHNWRGAGGASFLLDVTWGLGATTNACLMHACNVFGTHAPDTRTGAHRYEKGIHFKASFAFTQGSVMSELPDPPGSPLFKHELLHVWQNRSFGPLFLLSYLVWMVLWFIPSILAGLFVGRFPDGPQEWCYSNNPWEVWAYAVQRQPRNVLSGLNPRLVWPPLYVVLWAVPFYIAFTVMFVLTIRWLWL